MIEGGGGTQGDEIQESDYGSYKVCLLSAQWIWAQSKFISVYVCVVCMCVCVWMEGVGIYESAIMIKVFQLSVVEIVWGCTERVRENEVSASQGL